MSSPSRPGPAAFGAALSELFAALDWETLGSAYCHEGGESFFPPEQIEAVQEAGLQLAGEVAEALERLRGGPARSLYVGAALAELPVALCEQLVVGRELVLVSRPSPETSELNRALAVAESSTGLTLPRVQERELGGRDDAPSGPFDHLWLVSVLTDPEAFPALHDHLYERTGSELATGRGDRRREKRRAEWLLDQVVATLRPPTLVTTSDEELPLMSDALARRGLGLEIPERARLSAIVGDTVRICRATEQPRKTSR